MQVACVILGDTRDAGLQALVDHGTELDRGPVRADVDRLAPLDSKAPGVPRRELDLRRRPLELELRDALDRGAREERPVAEQLQRAAGRLGRDRLVRALGRSRL